MPKRPIHKGYRTKVVMYRCPVCPATILAKPLAEPLCGNRGIYWHPPGQHAAVRMERVRA